MKRFFSITGMYLVKTLCGVKFWLAVALYMGLLFIISQDLFSEMATVTYIIHYAFANSTSYFLLVICAMPGAVIFAEEWQARRFVVIFTRGKKWPFAASMIFTSFFTAFLVSMIASALYFAFLSVSFPVIEGLSDGSFTGQLEIYTNGGLALSGNFFMYFFIQFVTQGCLMGLFSAMAALLSIALTDVNITVVLPMILYIVITNIMNLLPISKLFNPYHVYSQFGVVYRIFFPNSTNNFSVISMMYPMIYTVVLLAIFTVAAYFMIKRKCERYSDIG